jgi:single-strand DNA-binding protein
MATSLNRVTLIGNMGKDPVKRTMQDGKHVMSFSLATSDRWKDKTSGEVREKTEWHNIVIFAQPIINLLESYAHKGTKLMVEGSLHTRKYTDQTGVDRTIVEIIVQPYSGSVMILDSRVNAGHRNQEDNSRDPVHSDDTKVANFDLQQLDDEVPF